VCRYEKCPSISACHRSSSSERRCRSHSCTMCIHSSLVSPYVGTSLLTQVWRCVFLTLTYPHATFLPVYFSCVVEVDEWGDGQREASDLFTLPRFPFTYALIELNLSGGRTQWNTFSPYFSGTVTAITFPSLRINDPDQLKGAPNTNIRVSFKRSIGPGNGYRCLNCVARLR